MKGSKRARERWKILANVISGKKPIDSETQNKVSVRRFSGFGLFRVEHLNENSTCYSHFAYSSCFNELSSTRILVRTKKQTVNLQELIGFNNTGNICIWPAEEVLAYYVLHHYSEFEGKRVCELGAGMTALAGVMLASSCDVTEMLLTDGNLESVQNIDHIIEKNIECFGSTKVHSRKLIWGDDTVSCDMRNKYDVVIAADCFFHVESHESLLKTLDALLVEEGRAVMMAPCRSQTLQQFCSRASPMFDVQIIRNYDHKITEKHLKVSSSNIEDYDEDLHYPVLVILSRKKLKPDE